jgi:hypothetical protein
LCRSVWVFNRVTCFYRDKKVVGVFLLRFSLRRFRASQLSRTLYKYNWGSSSLI